MRSWWVLALFGCSCVGGQTGTPASDDRPGFPSDCEARADAATALGVRGDDLLAVYAQSWTLKMRRVRWRGSHIVDLPSAEVVVSVAPGFDDGRAMRCEEVAVAVTVSLSSNDGLREIADGVLAGTLASAGVSFSSPEVNGKKGATLRGAIDFSPGLTGLEFTVDDDTWFYEDAP